MNQELRTMKQGYFFLMEHLFFQTVLGENRFIYIGFLHDFKIEG